MMKNTPDTTNNQTLVKWFAGAGLTVEVVDHCADAAFEQCGGTLDQAA